MMTPKQEKFVRILIENTKAKGSTKTLGEMMVEAGYTEKNSKNPYQVLQSDGVKEELTGFVKELENKRKKALNYLTDSKLDEAKAKDLITVINGLTKDIQLLTGGDTEKLNTTIEIVSYENTNTTSIPTEGISTGVSEKPQEVQDSSLEQA